LSCGGPAALCSACLGRLPRRTPAGSGWAVRGQGSTAAARGIVALAPTEAGIGVHAAVRHRSTVPPHRGGRSADKPSASSEGKHQFPALNSQGRALFGGKGNTFCSRCEFAPFAWSGLSKCTSGTVSSCSFELMNVWKTGTVYSTAFPITCVRNIIYTILSSP